MDNQWESWWLLGSLGSPLSGSNPKDTGSHCENTSSWWLEWSERLIKNLRPPTWENTAPWKAGCSPGRGNVGHSGTGIGIKLKILEASTGSCSHYAATPTKLNFSPAALVLLYAVSTRRGFSLGDVVHCRGWESTNPRPITRPSPVQTSMKKRREFVDGILCNKRDCFSAVVEGSNTVFAFLPHQKKAEKTQFKHQLPWRSTVKITRNPSWQSPRALHLTLSRNFHATPHHLKEFLEAKDSDSIVRHWVESSGLMARKWFNPVLRKWQGLVESFRKMLLFPMFPKNRYTVYQRPTTKKQHIILLRHLTRSTALTCPKIVPFTEKNHPHLEVNHTIAIAIHFLQQVYDSSMSQSAFDLRSKLVKWSVTIPNWFRKKELTEDMWGFKAYLHLNRDRMMCIYIDMID